MKYDGRISGGSKGASGNAFRGRTGMFYAVSGTDWQRRVSALLRDQGRFTSLQREVRNVNGQLAEQLANLMVVELEQSRVPYRKGVGTGRLARALLDRRNRHVDQGGFGVGSPLWLNQSEAKYWRAIELGSSHFVGRMLTGVWGESLTGNTIKRGRFGPYPEAGPRFTGFGANRNGRLLPMTRGRAYQVLRASGVTRTQIRKDWMGARGIVREPIRAHRYMRDAWKDFNIAGRARAVVTQVFRAAGLPPPRPAGGGRMNHRR